MAPTNPASQPSHGTESSPAGWGLRWNRTASALLKQLLPILLCVAVAYLGEHWGGLGRLALFVLAVVVGVPLVLLAVVLVGVAIVLCWPRRRGLAEPENQNFVYTVSGEVQQPDWLVEYRGRPIARLQASMWEAPRYFVRYDIVPLTCDPELLSRFVNDGSFWNSRELTFRNESNGRRARITMVAAVSPQSGSMLARLFP